jgi:hypothetical protein
VLTTTFYVKMDYTHSLVISPSITVVIYCTGTVSSLLSQTPEYILKYDDTLQI